MSGAIFRCQSKRESRGAKTTDATASVVAQWAGLSTTATAKFKEIYQFDINIRKVRLGLLIFPCQRWGMVSSCREGGATSFGQRGDLLPSE